MRYKHIIWDFNGTLIDDVELCMSIMNVMLQKNNLGTLTLKKYREIFTFPVIDYYEKAGLSKSDFGEHSVTFITEYEKNKFKCEIFPEAYNLLQKNIENGVSQSVLSAYKQSTLEEILEYFGLSKYFIKIIGQSDIYANGKVEEGKKWIEELGINKKDVLMIGDTVHDHEVAVAMGVDCILMSNGHSSKDKLVSTNRFVVDSFYELDKFLWD